LIRIGNGGTRDYVDYMLKILWPKIVRVLDRPEISMKSLEEHLVGYVELHTGTRDIPSVLKTFARLKRGSAGH